jgi:hypothetical protein
MDGMDLPPAAPSAAAPAADAGTFEIEGDLAGLAEPHDWASGRASDWGDDT